jgi:hypothetical protein
MPPAGITGAAAVASAGEVKVQVTSSITVDTEVIRAPFSEASIAERLAADPEFYKRLAIHVALELRAHATGLIRVDKITPVSFSKAK